MSVYKRGNSKFYSYDFRVDGRRYSGETGTDDLVAAAEVERTVKSEAQSTTGLCRLVLRRALKRLPTRARADTGSVYMIRSGYFIKIGFSVNPEQRFDKISTATPNDCELLFCIPGSLSLEKELHREFAASHYRREWFFLCGKLKQFIAEFEAAKQPAQQPLPREITRLQQLVVLND